MTCPDYDVRPFYGQERALEALFLQNNAMNAIIAAAEPHVSCEQPQELALQTIWTQEYVIQTQLEFLRPRLACKARERADDSQANECELLMPNDGLDFTVAPREHHGCVYSYILLFLTFASFVLMLAACCPVALYRTGNGTVWTIWRNNARVRWTDVACRHKTQMFQAIEGFCIMGCVFCLLAFIAVVALSTGWGHYGVTLFICFLATTTTLVAWALMVNQYHWYNCPGEISYSNGINRLNAAFCFAVVSFGLMLFACVVLLYYLIAYFTLDDCTRCRFRPHLFVASMLMAACLILICVGSAFTLWEANFTGYVVRITLWHVQVVFTPAGVWETWGIGDYHCSTINRMFNVARAFVLISTLPMFLAYLFCLAAVYHCRFMWPSMILAVLTWAFLFVYWVVMVCARYSDFCPGGANVVLDGVYGIPSGTGVTQNVNWQGYTITEGLGMIIAVWCAIPFIIMYMLLLGRRTLCHVKRKPPPCCRNKKGKRREERQDDRDAHADDWCRGVRTRYIS